MAQVARAAFPIGPASDICSRMGIAGPARQQAASPDLSHVWTSALGSRYQLPATAGLVWNGIMSNPEAPARVNLRDPDFSQHLRLLAGSPPPLPHPQFLLV